MLVVVLVSDLLSGVSSTRTKDENEHDVIIQSNHSWQCPWHKKTTGTVGGG